MDVSPSYLRYGVNTIVHCDSNTGIYKVDEELDTKPHIEVLSVITARDCDIGHFDTHPNNRKDTLIAKQATPEVDGTQPPRKAARRSRDSSVLSSSSGTDGEEKPRVGCPYFKRDPNGQRHKVSCRGLGFAEMAKLKDHLKAVHNLKASIYREKLNFKSKKFASLKTIDKKWELVFKILFPGISVPSPYSNHDYTEINHAIFEDKSRVYELGCLFKNKLLSEPTLGDIEASFDRKFHEAVTEWQKGTASSPAANIFTEDHKSDKETLEMPLVQNGGLYATPPLSTSSRSTPAYNDIGLCNGLSDSPNLGNSESDKSPYVLESLSAYGHSGQKSLEDYILFSPPDANLATDLVLTPAPVDYWVDVSKGDISEEEMPFMAAPYFATSRQHAPHYDTMVTSICRNPLSQQPTYGIESDDHFQEEGTTSAAEFKTSTSSPGICSPFMGYEIATVDDSSWL